MYSSDMTMVVKYRNTKLYKTQRHRPIARLIRHSWNKQFLASLLRRIYCDLVTCFKITHQLVSVPFSSMFGLSASRATRGHPFKLAYPDSRINVRANFFPVRVVALWNRLPEYVVVVSRLTTFERRLRTVNMSYSIQLYVYHSLCVFMML